MNNQEQQEWVARALEAERKQAIFEKALQECAAERDALSATLRQLPISLDDIFYEVGEEIKDVVMRELSSIKGTLLDAMKRHDIPE